MFRLTIIGGGLSGTLLTIQILEKNKDLPIHITLIDKRSEIGKGVAYSTDKDFHLLNVAAPMMSAFPDRPDHFVEWLQKNSIPLSVSGFMPRKIYAQYIQDLFAQAVKNSSNTTFIDVHLQDEVTDINFKNGKAEVVLKSSKAIHSDKAVFAFGNFPPKSLSGVSEDLQMHPRICNDPWDCNSLDAASPTDTIVIVGTGLTMVDFCMTLHKRNHKGKIFCISNHGYLPAVHRPHGIYHAFYEDLKNCTTALSMFKVVRLHLRKAKEKGIDWRAVIDSLRPYTQDLWIQLPRTEKSVFLKYLSRIWNVGRHRIPPEGQRVLYALTETGQLEIISGRLLSFKKSGEKIEVEYKNKTENILTKIEVDYVLNCTGPQTNYGRLKSTLINNLLRKGIIKQGPSQMGIEAYPDGRVINEFSKDTFYTLGPPLSGVLLESTAVPEIREQAHQLAQKILYDFKKLRKEDKPV